MFDIVGQLKLPDGNEGLKHEQPKACPAADGVGNSQKQCLQDDVTPEWVAAVPDGQAGAFQLGAFGPPGRVWPGQQHTGEKAVEPLVVARGHGVARGADPGVMHQQMFGAEM